MLAALAYCRRPPSDSCQWTQLNPLAVLGKPDFSNCYFQHAIRYTQWQLSQQHSEPLAVGRLIFLLLAESFLQYSKSSAIMMAQSKITILNIHALDTLTRLRAMANNVAAAIPELTASSRQLLNGFVDTATQAVAKYRDIKPRAITLNKLRDGKIRGNKTGKKYRQE